MGAAVSVSNTAFPARGLIGFQGEFLNLTRGTGLMSHVFDEYAPVKGDIPGRRNGVLISAESAAKPSPTRCGNCRTVAACSARPGDKLYEGMVIGIHSRENDLVVNPIKGKQLTNVRASGTDEAVRLVPPVALTLESAVEFIDDDELVEITPRAFASASACSPTTSAEGPHAKGSRNATPRPCEPSRRPTKRQRHALCAARHNPDLFTAG
jgi:predicted membrane GTPase involved in stress response